MPECGRSAYSGHMIPFKPTSHKPSPTNFVNDFLEDQGGNATAEVGTVHPPGQSAMIMQSTGCRLSPFDMTRIALMLQAAEPGLKVVDQPLQWRAPTGARGLRRQPEPSAQPRRIPIAAPEGRLSGPVLSASPAAAAAEQHEAAQLSLVETRQVSEVEDPAAASTQGPQEAWAEGKAQLAQQASHGPAVLGGESGQCHSNHDIFFVEVQGTWTPGKNVQTALAMQTILHLELLLHGCRLV